VPISVNRSGERGEFDCAPINVANRIPTGFRISDVFVVPCRGLVQVVDYTIVSVKILPDGIQIVPVTDVSWVASATRILGIDRLNESRRPQYRDASPQEISSIERQVTHMTFAPLTAPAGNAYLLSLIAECATPVNPIHVSEQLVTWYFPGIYHVIIPCMEHHSAIQFVSGAIDKR
jgi:hypothetical protein